MTVPPRTIYGASGISEAILPVPARMASRLVLALVFSLATGQHWWTNMDEDITGQYWPGSNIEEEETGQTGQYWPGSNIEEEAIGQTGQYWPVAPLGEEGADMEHEAEVGQPERLEMLT